MTLMIAQPALAVGPAKSPGAAPKAQLKASPASFAWTARPGGVDMDARADQKRDEAAEKLERLLPAVADGPQKAEVLFRLSEIYWTKSRYLHLKAMQQWDKALQTWHGQGSLGPEPKVTGVPAHAQAEHFKAKALALYAQIIERYTEYGRQDEVLYNLGSALYDSGDKRQGVAKFRQLIKQAPTSEYAADAWLQLGEHFFNDNKLSEAIDAYAKAAETKKPRIYSYALYKLAWCDFNAQDYQAALEKFRLVVNYSKKQKNAGHTGDMGERDRVQLQNEALLDMVRAYSHLDAVDDAFVYYGAEVGKDKAYTYLRKLAGLYNSEGKYDLEIATYRRLNDDYPYHAEAPQNQTAIMAAYAHLGRLQDLRVEARRLIELYSPSALWAQRNAANPEVLAKAFAAVETELAAVVTEQHRAAQTTKLVDTYRLARDLYKDYLDKFSDAKNSYAFRFYYAEILFELHSYQEAAQQYTLVVQSDKQGKFAKPAAYTAMLAWERVLSGGGSGELGQTIKAAKAGKAKGSLERLEQLAALRKGERYEATPLSPAEASLVAACDTFVDVAESDDEVVKVKFKAARLYYIHNQFESAAKRFGEIIEKWPNHELARLGANSILQSYNARSDWAQLNVWARTFAANKALMADVAFGKTLGSFVEGASFNEIHFIYEPKGDAKDTADRYAAFAQEFPRSKYVMVALFNAVVNYDKANRLELAMQSASVMLKDYASFALREGEAKELEDAGGALPAPAQLREKIQFMQASFYERLALIEEASDLYEAYARNFKTGKKRPDALFNAGIFREGLGQYDAALTNLASYVNDYPHQDDVADIAWRMGLIEEKKGDFKAAKRRFELWGQLYGNSRPQMNGCAIYKTVEALKHLGDEREAKRRSAAFVSRYAKDVTDAKAPACLREAVAAASFDAIEDDFAAYMRLRLAGNETQIANTLTQKLREVESLQQRYTAVLGLLEGNYGIASLYRIGVIYRDLAEQIFASPCPARLDEDQCGIYQAMLQEKAFPLEEKSIEAFGKALAKAYELGLYNSWLAKTQDALRGYEPNRFPDVHVYELVASDGAAKDPGFVEARR